MIFRTFKFEARFLMRDRSFLLMSLTLMIMIGLANFNGLRQWDFRQQTIKVKSSERAEADAAMIALARKLKNGEDPELGYYDNPTNPMGIGWKQPRLAVYETGPMGLIATGHSDIFRHTIEVSVYGEQAYQPDLKEMRSPIQQLIGFFDLSLVLVYLFPLFALAVSFNLIAGDRERGSLALLLAQGIAVKQWLFVRVLARYVFTLAVVGISTLGSLALLGVLGKMPATNLVSLACMTALYGALWFTIAYGVNLRRGSSANHGFLLMLIWAMVLLVIPAGLNQIARVIYPMPSRVSQVNAMRMAVAEAERAQGRTFAQFYQRHPDLKPSEEVGQDTGRGWFMNYFAIQAESWRTLKPMLDVFEAHLDKRNRLVEIAGTLSPAIPFSAAMDQLAGTSPAHYRSWRDQVSDFSQTWKDYVFPKVFHEQWLEVEELEHLPAFTFNHRAVKTNLSAQWLIMFCQGMILAIWAFGFANPKDIYQN